MKATIKQDFLLHSIANEQILIGAGEQINFSKMLMLNNTAAWIITELQKQPATSEELALRLTKTYEITEQKLNRYRRIILPIRTTRSNYY